jgi:hypothetical protein
MKRLTGVLALSTMLFALCGSVDAQQTGKIFRIGFLDPSTASGSAGLVEVFLQNLGKFGWIEGKILSSSPCLRGQDLERCQTG